MHKHQKLTRSTQGRSEKHGEDGSGLIDGEAGGRRRKGTARFRRTTASQHARVDGEAEERSAELVAASVWLREALVAGYLKGMAAAAVDRELLGLVFAAGRGRSREQGARE